MKVGRIMMIAGEASGDALGAELAKSLRITLPGAPKVFGAGGNKMQEADVEIAVNMLQHAVIGLSDVLLKYTQFRRIFHQLLQLAIDRKPELIVLVDFSGFNRRFANAIRKHIRANQSSCGDWSPKIVQFVSPQVWASRPSRAEKMARDIDLLLCLFPFEKDWYAKRVPDLRVEFVGHPIFDRYANFEMKPSAGNIPTVVLLPGSRHGELTRHLSVMTEAARQISVRQNVRFKMVLPTAELRQIAESTPLRLPDLELQTGHLAEALSEATIAIASTGTVLLECAYFGVPTVAMYRTSWGTYQIGKRIVRVKFLSMPNILADEMVFPEFIQDDATSENIAATATQLLNAPERRAKIKQRLSEIVASLGSAGASHRAAEAISKLFA